MCSLIPRITLPTRFSLRSKTFISNNFYAGTAKKVIGRNILTSLSGHQAQFLLFPIQRTKPESETNTCCHSFKRFDPKVFLQDIQTIDWHAVLTLNEEDVDNLFDQFF